MTAESDSLLPEVSKDGVEVSMKSMREVESKAMTAVPLPTISEPILLNFGKREPCFKQRRLDRRISGDILQKAHVTDQFFVKRLVTGVVAVKEEKGVNKEGKIVDQRDVEGPILLKKSWRYPEEVLEVNVHLV